MKPTWSERIRKGKPKRSPTSFVTPKRPFSRTLERSGKAVRPDLIGNAVENVGEQVGPIWQINSSLSPAKTGKVVEEVVNEREKFVHLGRNHIVLMTEFYLS